MVKVNVDDNQALAQEYGIMSIPTLLLFKDGEVAMRDPRLAITSLAGVIALTKDRVRFVDFRAAANGGTLELGGEVTLEAFVPAGGTMTLVEGNTYDIELAGYTATPHCGRAWGL